MGNSSHIILSARTAIILIREAAVFISFSVLRIIELLVIKIVLETFSFRLLHFFQKLNISIYYVQTMYK